LISDFRLGFRIYDLLGAAYLKFAERGDRLYADVHYQARSIPYILAITSSKSHPRCFLNVCALHVFQRTSSFSRPFSSSNPLFSAPWLAISSAGASLQAIFPPKDESAQAAA
jgi:hypothetical protein